MQYKGKKTDASWMRANKVIQNVFGELERSSLAALWQGDAEVLDMASAYLTIISEAGVNTEDTVPNDLVLTWANVGVPREVWDGYSRYDEFAKPPGKDYYAPINAKVIRKGSNSLRKIFRNYYESFKMLLDLKQERTAHDHNPGGIADASKNA